VLSYTVLSAVASRATRVKACIPRTEYRRKAPRRGDLNAGFKCRKNVIVGFLRIH